MSLSDPIGDLLARIRNGQMARHGAVRSPNSKKRRAVLDVLKKEGFIRGYSENELRKGVSELRVELKYYDGEPVIRELRRVSRPGLRNYSSVRDMPRVRNGLGVLIVSTSQGLMSDADARERNIGGEVVAQVF